MATMDSHMSFSADGEPTSSENSPLLSSKSGTAKRGRASNLLRIAVVAAVVFATSVAVIAGLRDFVTEKKPHVAFIGNSMQYYNDLPRFLETLSAGHMVQNSCLHGGTTLSKILVDGNGMFDKFDTPNALVKDDFDGASVYDFGACTVPQLLFGHDKDLQEQVYWKTGYLEDDGLNPCLQQGRYFDYLQDQRKDKHNKPPSWDYIFFNDRTTNPGRNETRAEGLQILQTVYLPWFQQTGATPVFLDTHAYWTEHINLTGLAENVEDMPHFTSVTYEGYRQYAQMLSGHLPVEQEPRIAPVGIAFLLVWEEDRALWYKLFHSDHLHASPIGTFLTGCIVYYTVFQKLPSPAVCFIPNMSLLWSHARVMQDKLDPPNPFPTSEEAEFLYNICERVAVHGERPASFVSYSNGKSDAY